MAETTNENQSEEIAEAREKYLEARRNCQETNLAVLQTMLEYLEAYKRYGFAQLVDYEAECSEGQAREEYHELVPDNRRQAQVEVLDEDEDEDEDE